MYLSCTTCALRAKGLDEIEETLKHAPAAGYKHWGMAGPITWEPGLIRWLDVEGLAKSARNVGLETLTEIYCPTLPTHEIEAARFRGEQVVLNAKAAAKMDCTRIVQSGGPRRDGGIEKTIAGTERLLEGMEGIPVNLCLEPHHNTQIQLAEDYDAIFSALDSPQLGITIDTGQFHSSGVDWVALIRKYPDKIYNVHVKDHIGEQSVGIGQGEIDFKLMVDVLREIGYDGPLAIEIEANDPENLPRYAKEAYDYMSAILKD